MFGLIMNICLNITWKFLLSRNIFRCETKWKMLTDSLHVELWYCYVKVWMYLWIIFFFVMLVCIFLIKIVTFVYKQVLLFCIYFIYTTCLITYVLFLNRQSRNLNIPVCFNVIFALLLMWHMKSACTRLCLSILLPLLQPYHFYKIL